MTGSGEMLFRIVLFGHCILPLVLLAVFPNDAMLLFIQSVSHGLFIAIRGVSRINTIDLTLICPIVTGTLVALALTIQYPEDPWASVSGIAIAVFSSLNGTIVSAIRLSITSIGRTM